MAIFRQGIKTTLGTQFVANTSNSTQVTLATQQNNNLSNIFIPVRVTDIVLNDKHPKFIEVGEWNGIGTIFYETIGYNEKSTGFAYPFDPHFKTFPLANEIVLLVLIPSKFTDTKQIQNIYYYLNPIGIWNHPHHNASPKLNSEDSYNTLSAQQQNDYDKTDVGYVRRVDDDNSTEIDLNYLYYPNPSQSTFKEKVNLHPLLPFMGDAIFEGRWGNSLRFGSTSPISLDLPTEEIPSLEFKNNWSSIGSNGDPITILRNGQPPEENLPKNISSSGWIPIVENISQDLSSIYLTSYQQLNTFKVASELYQSYKTPPIFPSQYKNPQVILNSDRIVINAKTDSILLSAQQSIGMSTNGSVNIDATSHYISSNDIKLGSKNATQPVLLGNDTIETLKQLTSAIKDLATILQVQRDYPEGKLVTSYNAIAGNVIIVLDNITKTLNDNSLKSQTTKVQ